MTSPKNKPWFFSWKVFGDGNGSGNHYRHEFNRRALKQGKSSSSVANVVVFLFFVFIILFCYAVSSGSGWINHPMHWSNPLQTLTLSTSYKPLPPPPPPPGKSLIIPSQISNPITVKSLIVPTQIQNLTETSKLSSLPMKSSTIPSQTSNQTDKTSINFATISTQIQNSTETSKPPTLICPTNDTNPTCPNKYSTRQIQNSNETSKLPPTQINSLTVPSQTSNQTKESSTKFPTTSTQIQNSTETSKPPTLICPANGTNPTCPNSYPTHQTLTLAASTQPSTCPDYFRWIHEDLRPWKAPGITRDMVERARQTAHFRLVILDGKVYVRTYKKSIQTRDKFTLWGILQLLRWYPGKLPDLELLFDCNDRPVIPAKRFGGPRPHSGPPPLFRYCSDPWSLDIVFPDWSFWGWAETNIKPWRASSRDIEQGNKKIEWEDRVPYAYWKGNPSVAPWRHELLKCNVSNETDWNARIYIQDWEKEKQMGYKESNPADQCTHRYKIYMEGWAWSVSDKYILGCDSMTLRVKPKFHEFFTRGMLPLVHYWPIREKETCKSLKFAVEWGNNHTDEAQKIGRAGSRYALEDMKMEVVYDYMFHLLNEYAKLLRFKPQIPAGAVELCPETMACQEGGVWRNFMEESLEKYPSDRVPCDLPPPYEPSSLRSFLEKKENLTRQVEMWEDEYWAKLEHKGTKP